MGALELDVLLGATIIVGGVLGLHRGNTITLLTPFAAFVLAELLGASGVLAVVVAGLLMGHAGPRIVGAGVRRRAPRRRVLLVLGDASAQRRPFRARRP